MDIPEKKRLLCVELDELDRRYIADWCDFTGPERIARLDEIERLERRIGRKILLIWRWAHHPHNPNREVTNGPTEVVPDGTGASDVLTRGPRRA